MVRNKADFVILQALRENTVIPENATEDQVVQAHLWQAMFRLYDSLSAEFDKINVPSNASITTHELETKMSEITAPPVTEFTQDTMERKASDLEIRRVIRNIEQTIFVLSDTIETLGNRLSPILSPSPEEEVEESIKIGETASRPSTQLGQCLEEIKSKLASFNEELTDVLDRLQI